MFEKRHVFTRPMQWNDVVNGLALVDNVHSPASVTEARFIRR